ncbi:hypothetical protein PPACK8108_LOCUS19057 [Phakopsora pachyrhizi]|uniref:Uncharacterized protein n=1 Tax=Phakopsora pachyrhizi TaxID=170000 RepID=A0AAV0BDX8_PHAPC|nr:hypothetical protein PPACK8108_LOCUS19057 [Phakopsora pachyrhizi]
MSERNHPPLEQLINPILFQDLPGLLALFEHQMDAVHAHPAPPEPENSTEPIQLLATPVLVLYAPLPTLALDAGDCSIIPVVQMVHLTFDAVATDFRLTMYLNMLDTSTFGQRIPSMFNHRRALVLDIVDLVHDLFTNPYTVREQLARTIMELEIEDLMESESDSDREEDILLLHDLYTKHYLFSQSSINLSKTYSPEDLM